MSLVAIFTPTVVVLTAVVVGGSWLLLKRQRPVLTCDNDLPTSNIPDVSSVDATVSLHLVSRLSPQEKELMTEAFLSARSLRWVSMIDDDGDDVDRSEVQKALKRHQTICQYILNCDFAFAERYGYIIVARRMRDTTVNTTNDTEGIDEEDDTDSLFLGAICLIPPYQRHSMFMLHLVRSCLSMGKPPIYGMGQEIKARFFACGQNMTVYQQVKKECADVSHWYVATLAVIPSAQGKGIGRILNQVAVNIAATDTANIKAGAIYLCCHNGNVPFYEKLGYECKRRYTLTPKTRGSGKPVTCPYNAMVYGYQPKTHQ
jgi:ribosomal protein S18 acetylase RimI-like enzyme